MATDGLKKVAVGQREKPVAGAVRMRLAVAGIGCAIVVVAAALVIASKDAAPRQQVDVAASPASPRSTTIATSTDAAPSAEGSIAPAALQAVTSDGNADGGASPSGDEADGDESTSSDGPSSGEEPVHGLTVEVSPNPTAGELILVTLHVTNRRPDDQVGLRRDTTGPAWWEGPPSASRPFGTPCSPERNVPRTNGSYTFSATYRLPGRHTLLAVVGCSGSQPEPAVSVPVDIDVAGPVGPSNGPFAPRFLYGLTTFEPDPSADPTATYLSLNVQDNDGVLDHLLIDWGDGTPPEVIPIVLDPSSNDHACDATQEYWDTVDMRAAPHHYVVKKTYTVMVTAFSVGCNGEEPHQQGSASTSLDAV